MKALAGALRPRLGRRHSVIKQELKVWFDHLFIFKLSSGHNVMLWSLALATISWLATMSPQPSPPACVDSCTSS
eukprot:COSAG01_NODE_208_length_21996_cov_31.972097_21_plen_74_part_00